MRIFTIIAFACILSFATACTTSGNDIVSPQLPESGQSNDFSNTPEYENECRATMRTIASQMAMYMAYHNKYPKTLEEMGMTGVVCPECGLEYFLTADNETYRIECPLPSDPNHGFIDNGVPSWGGSITEE